MLETVLCNTTCVVLCYVDSVVLETVCKRKDKRLPKFMSLGIVADHHCRPLTNTTFNCQMMMMMMTKMMMAKMMMMNMKMMNMTGGNMLVGHDDKDDEDDDDNKFNFSPHGRIPRLWFLMMMMSIILILCDGDGDGYNDDDD